MTRRSRLTDMVLDEISLVDAGANPEAKVVIVKAKGPAADKASADDEPDDSRKIGKRAEAIAALRDVIKSMAPAIIERVGAACPEFQGAAGIAAALLKERDMDLQELEKALKEAEKALADASTVAKAKDEEIAKLKAERDEAIAKAKKPEQTDEDIMKGLPEPVRKRLEEAEAVARVANERVEKMAAAAEEADAILKAKDLGIGDAKAIGPLLLRVRKGKSTEADAAEIERLLKAAANQATTAGLFKSAGSAASDVADPEAVLKAKAEEIRKADPKLTYEQAYDRATRENPGLYTAYIAKRR